MGVGVGGREVWSGAGGWDGGGELGRFVCRGRIGDGGRGSRGGGSGLGSSLGVGDRGSQGRPSTHQVEERLRDVLHRRHQVEDVEGGDGGGGAGGGAGAGPEQVVGERSERRVLRDDAERHGETDAVQRRDVRVRPPGGAVHALLQPLAHTHTRACNRERSYSAIDGKDSIR